MRRDFHPVIFASRSTIIHTCSLRTRFSVPRTFHFPRSVSLSLSLSLSLNNTIPATTRFSRSPRFDLHSNGELIFAAKRKQPLVPRGSRSSSRSFTIRFTSACSFLKIDSISILSYRRESRAARQSVFLAASGMKLSVARKISPERR